MTNCSIQPLSLCYSIQLFYKYLNFTILHWRVRVCMYAGVYVHDWFSNKSSNFVIFSILQQTTLKEVLMSLYSWHSCQHGLKKMRDVFLISLAFTRHLPHQHLDELEWGGCPIYHCRFRSAFSNKMSPRMNIIAIFSDFWRLFESKVARRRYYWRFRRDSRIKCLRTAKMIAIFSDFCCFEIKQEMRDVLAKMRECGK